MIDAREAFIATATNELDEFYITLVEATDHGGHPVPERWRISKDKARKLFRELAERLI